MKKRWLLLIPLPLGIGAVLLPFLYGMVLWIIGFLLWYVLLQRRSGAEDEGTSPRDYVDQGESEENSPIAHGAERDISGVDEQPYDQREANSPVAPSLTQGDDRGAENLIEKETLQNLWKEKPGNLESHGQEDSLDLVKESQGILDQLNSSQQVIQGNISQVFNISDNLTKNAKQAFTMAETLQKDTKAVNEVLDKAIMESGRLNEKSREISNVVEIMSEVASQIHVLSINASIVSARAGDYGRGFEVVAKEIRKLAENTDESLGTIDDKVKDIQEAINGLTEQISLANTSIRTEQETLLSVAGSLEGLMLGVEIINTVSMTAKDSSENQNEKSQEIQSKLEVLTKKINLRCDELGHKLTQYKSFMDQIEDLWT